MKSIVAASLLLISSGGSAQTIHSTLPDFGSIERQPAQVEQMAVAHAEMISDSRPTGETVNSIFSSSSPVISAAVARPMTSVKPPSSPKFKTFSTSPLNRTLVATEFWTRGLDAFSTHRDLSNSCNCYHEATRVFGLSMTPMFKTTIGVYSYSLGIAATYSFLSLKLWNASQNHPRHARLLRTLSRALLIGDSLTETAADVRNFTITDLGPAKQ